MINFQIFLMHPHQTFDFILNILFFLLQRNVMSDKNLFDITIFFRDTLKKCKNKLGENNVHFISVVLAYFIQHYVVVLSLLTFATGDTVANFIHIFSLTLPHSCSFVCVCHSTKSTTLKLINILYLHFQI